MVRHRVIEHVYFARARHVLHDRFFETKVIETSDAVYQTIRTPRTQTVRVATTAIFVYKALFSSFEFRFLLGGPRPLDLP